MTVTFIEVNDTESVETAVSLEGPKEIKHDLLDKLPSREEVDFPSGAVEVDLVPAYDEDKVRYTYGQLDPKDFVTIDDFEGHIVVTAPKVIVGPQDLQAAPIQFLDKLARNLDKGAKIIGKTETNDGGRFGFGYVSRLYVAPGITG